MNNHLLNPIKIGPYDLPNRVIMSPMTRNRADNSGNIPTPLIAEYYTQRASAGLLITEGSQVSKQGVGYINTPGIHSNAQVEGWRQVTRAVHEKEGHIFIQLWHCGRMSHPDFHDGNLPVAPSAINPKDRSYTAEGFKDTVTPRSLTVDEIHETTNDFKVAAENAIAAGFDGVEIHSANGYLFHQFFTNCSNIREDDYGGNHENKARFFFETLDAVGGAIGFEKVGVRLNPSMHGFFGITLDEDTISTFEYIVKRLNDYKDLAYLHLTEPLSPVDDVPYAVKEVAKHFRPLYQGTLVINSAFDQESGDRIIKEGHADAVAFAKSYISNPDLVERIRRNEKWAAWNEATFFTPGKEGYTDYPCLDG